MRSKKFCWKKIVQLQKEPDKWRTFKVRDGDNLSLIFAKAGFSDRDLYEVVRTSADGKKLSKLYPKNHTVSFQSNVNGDLIGIEHRRSLLESTSYWRDGDSFKSKEIILTPEKGLHGLVHGSKVLFFLQDSPLV